MPYTALQWPACAMLVVRQNAGCSHGRMSSTASSSSGMNTAPSQSHCQSIFALSYCHKRESAAFDSRAYRPASCFSFVCRTTQSRAQDTPFHCMCRTQATFNAACRYELASLQHWLSFREAQAGKQSVACCWAEVSSVLSLNSILKRARACAAALAVWGSAPE